MASGPQVGPDGLVRVSQGGKVIVSSTTSPDKCCCGNDNTPPPVCGSEADCLDFCDHSKKGSTERANCPGCDCGCPGRVSWPACRSIEISGASITTDKQFYSDGTYLQLQSDPSIPTVTECTVTHRGSGDPAFPDPTPEFGGYHWQHFSADGMTVLDDIPDAYVVISMPNESGVDASIVTGWTTDSGATYYPPFVGLTAIISAGRITPPNNTFIGSVGATNVDNGMGGRVFDYSPKFPICAEASATGTTDVTQTDPGNENPESTLGDDPPHLVTAPKCTNCDGSPCSPSSNVATVCTSPFMHIEVFSGTTTGVDGDGDPITIPVYTPYDFSFTPGPCTFTAADNDGFSVISVGAISCSPWNQQFIPGSGDYNTNPSWAMFVETPLGVIHWPETSGSCPTGFTTDPTQITSTTIDSMGYPLFINMDFEQGTGC